MYPVSYEDFHFLLHSAGVGRTGTLITIDNVLEQVEKEGVVDIATTVSKLRQQRPMMVQTAVRMCVSWCHLLYTYHYIIIDDLRSCAPPAIVCYHRCLSQLKCSLAAIVAVCVYVCGL